MSNKSKDNQTINIEQLNVINQVKESDSSNKSENEQVKEKETIDIIKFLIDAIKEHKEVIVSLITIIGILISVINYVSNQGYYSSFGINDDKWFNAGDKSIYYKIVFPFCMSILLLLPNLISALPFIFKKERHIKIWYEILWSLTSFSFLLSLLYLKIPNWIVFISGLVTIILVIVSLSKDLRKSYWCLGIWSFLVIIMGIVVFLKRNMLPNATLFFSLLIIWCMMVLLYLPFISIGKNNGTETTENRSDNINEKDRIKDRNISFIAFIISFLIVYAIFIVVIYSDGQVKAQNQKSFTVILLNEDEHYRNLSMDSTNISSKAADELLSDLPTDKEERNKVIDEIKEEYKDKPYIDIVEEKDEDGKKTTVLRRIVNAYIVIASSGDDSLVFNGYIDENNNLYYFSEEQRTIKTADYITNNMTFNQAIKG